MTKNTIIILAVLAAVGLGVVWYFRRKPAAEPVAAPIPQNRAAPVYAAPDYATAAPPKSVSVTQGVKIAATAGCAAAATAYSAGTLAPLCGLAAPLAVDAAKAGGKAIYSGIKGLFS